MLHFTVVLNALLYFSAVKAAFKVYDEVEDTSDRVVTHNELNKLWSNTVCCLKNLRCCRKEQDVQLRAVLVNCKDESETISYYEKMLKIDSITMPLHGFHSGEPISNSSIRQCRKKLLLTIKLNTPTNRNKINNEYLVVDYVSDPITHQNVKILTPYVVKFRQSVVSQMYKLDFLHVVNSNAGEKVFNKHSDNYTGCDTQSSTPTCGKMTYNGKDVPYSEGFCCSCDAKINAQRQPDPSNEYFEDIVTYSNPAFLLNGNECPRYLRAREIKNKNKNSQPDSWYQYVNPNVKKIARSVNQIYLNPHLSLKKRAELQYILNLYNRVNIKRQIQVTGEQERGWQNCIDKYTPRHVNPETFHESAHCLKFSNVWYSVYRLHRPQLEHSVLLQVFERHEDTSGRVIWKDLTNGKMIRIGTLSNSFEDKNKIVIKYSSRLRYVHHSAFAINHQSALFLVPDGITKEEYRNHPEVRNGPSEYLVVHNKQIRSSGDKCNVGGVGFEAFAKQPFRCSRPRGTCLSNQPYNLWLHDHQAENEGKKGCFFLKNYGTFPQNPIRRDPRTREQYLVMDFPDVESIKINMEIRANFNTMLSNLGPAKITEVYIDSTYSYKTVITIKITNSGLVSGYFSTRLQNCPLKIPASFSNIESIPTLIPPQHQHIFNLDIQVLLPLNKFHCTVEALNQDREVIAIRRILVQTYDRCFCTWHCLCTCLSSNQGLKCNPMSSEQYHAAGFRGSLPITVMDVNYTFIDEILTFIIYLIIYFLVALLLLGLIKGILGAFFNIRKIGMFGLDIILDLPQPIPLYYEYDLRRLEVIYDCEGWPIHPKTGARVRCIRKSTELCINVVFFFIYPICLCFLACRKLCNQILSKRKDYSNDDYHKTKCYCICDCEQSNNKREDSYDSSDTHEETKASKNTTHQNHKSLPPNVCKCICKCKHGRHSNNSKFKFSKKNKRHVRKLDTISDDNSSVCNCPRKITIDKTLKNEDEPQNSTASKVTVGRSMSSPKGFSKASITGESDIARASTNNAISEKSTEDSIMQEVINEEKKIANERSNRTTLSSTQIDIRNSSTNDEHIPSYDSSWTDQTDEYEIDR